jgi:hypothetical protein
MAESHAKETKRIPFANPLNENETSAINNIIFERKAIINEIYDFLRVLFFRKYRWT